MLPWPGSPTPATTKVLIDRLRLGSGDDFLETRIATERVPLPAQTQLCQRDVCREISPVDRAGCGKETLDQRDRLVGFADKRIYEGQIGLPNGTVKRILAFRIEPNGSTTFSDGILLSVYVGVE